MYFFLFEKRKRKTFKAIQLKIICASKCSLTFGKVELISFAKQTYLSYHLPQANLYLFSLARKRGALAFDYSAAEEDIVLVEDGGLSGGGGADGGGGLDKIAVIAERADHTFDVGGVVADADEAG